jgi:hypothetical protein
MICSCVNGLENFAAMRWSQLQVKRKGIRFSWPWKPPFPRLSQPDYWWRTGGINVFNDRLFEALRNNKKKNNNKRK